MLYGESNNDGVCGSFCALGVIFCRKVSYLLVYFLQLPKWLLFWEEDLLQDCVQLRHDKVTDPYMHCRCHRSPVLHVLTKVPSRPPTYMKDLSCGVVFFVFETFKYCFVKDSSGVKGHCNMFQSQHGLEDWALRLFFNKSVLKNFNRLTVDS